jgi:MFS family permease
VPIDFAVFAPDLHITVGAPIAGRISDITSRQWRQKRQGVWVPEDRLRKTWIGALVLCPLSIAASGLLTTFVDGPIGLALNLLCLFSNGAGVCPRTPTEVTFLLINERYD